MSVNSRIISAVSDIAPCYPWEAYEGSEDPTLARYFVFDYTTAPITFGDNAPTFERYSVQLHYFCPLGENSLSVREQAKRAVFKEFGLWPEETNATDNEGQHYCLEFETAEPIEGLNPDLRAYASIFTLGVSILGRT